MHGFIKKFNNAAAFFNNNNDNNHNNNMAFLNATGLKIDDIIDQAQLQPLTTTVSRQT